MSCEGNIFESFHAVKSAVLQDAETYGGEYLLLVEAIEKYFKSFVWTENENDRMIYLYSGRRLKSSVIADYMDINMNTYRSRVSRISAKLRDVLFHGSELSAVCLSGDLEVVKNARHHIERLNLQFDFYQEFKPKMLEKINSFISGCSDEKGTFSEAEMIQALFFLSKNSESGVEIQLKNVNPAALSYVVSQLSGEGYSDCFALYHVMQDDLRKNRQISEQLMKRWKQSAGLE